MVREIGARRVLRKAQELERRGDVSGAAALLRREGAYDEAAAVLVRARRPRDAANMLLRSIRLKTASLGDTQAPADLSGLKLEEKKRAFKAAICLSKAGDAEPAAVLFFALGEKPRALELLERTGLTVEAEQLRTRMESGPHFLSPASVTGERDPASDQGLEPPELPGLPPLPELPPLPDFEEEEELPLLGEGEADDHLVPGSILADRYRIREILGEGGMASVFRALDLELDEDVAVKVLNPALQVGVSLQRFKQEVSLNRKLNHPNIVRVYDFGDADGLRFITMELLSGRDLSHYLGAPIGADDVIKTLVQIARGLHAAHQAGVVHRDIKPANVFVCDDGVIKLMDFGIAKAGGAGLTKTEAGWGTPLYMSPEQIRGFSEVTRATDLYAVGVIAHEMLAGRAPFEHEEPVPLLMMHINDEPPPLRQLNPRVSATLEAIVLKLLEKAPEDRFPDCTALVRALIEVGQSL